MSKMSYRIQEAYVWLFSIVENAKFMIIPQKSIFYKLMTINKEMNLKLVLIIKSQSFSFSMYVFQNHWGKTFTLVLHECWSFCLFIFDTKMNARFLRITTECTTKTFFYFLGNSRDRHNWDVKWSKLKSAG